MARNPDLEAKLAEDPTNVDIHLVYADFLQSNGDPRGELVTLQNAGKDDEALRLIQKHEDTLLGPLKNYKVTFDGTSEDAFEWRLGFIRKAVFSYDSNCVGDVKVEEGVEISLPDGIATLLQHPSGALLEELVIPINMLDDGAYFGPVLEAIAKHGAPALRRLRIGRFECCGGPGGEGDYEYEISWTSLGDASKLWKAVPRLEELIIESGLGGSSASGTPDVLGDIDLPKLRRLEVITGGLSKSCAQSLFSAKAPELVYMDVWFGSDNYGGDTTLEDIEPVLSGDRFPKLEHLGLMNSEIADEICVALGSAGILPRLKELSLAYGTMTDEGATALASTAALAHLKKLDLHDNCLTSAGIDVVKGLSESVLTHGMKDADSRYCSLSE